MKTKPESVDAFMEQLDHPFKAEVQAVRAIIKGVDSRITEQIKWNAPSFRYTDYIATFTLHRQQHLLLTFHNPAIASIQSEILEGDYPDRRLVYFSDMADVIAKKAALKQVVSALMKIMDA